MLDQHEGHAAVGGQGIEDLLEGVETTRRSSQCDDREIKSLRASAARARSTAAGSGRAVMPCDLSSFWLS